MKNACSWNHLHRSSMFSIKLILLPKEPQHHGWSKLMYFRFNTGDITDSFILPRNTGLHWGLQAILHRKYNNINVKIMVSKNCKQDSCLQSENVNYKADLYNADPQLGAYILDNSNFFCCVYGCNCKWKIDFGITSKV